MSELIPINYNGEEPTVSARDLYNSLEISKRFSAWFETNSQGFVENEDFTSVLSGTVVNNGAHREIQDYSLSVDMAKHICLNYNGDRKHGSGAKTQRKVEPLIPFGTLSDDGDSDTLPFM